MTPSFESLPVRAHFCSTFQFSSHEQFGQRASIIIRPPQKIASMGLLAVTLVLQMPDGSFTHGPFTGSEPSMMTRSSLYRLKVMGLFFWPDRVSRIVSRYTPLRIQQVSPGCIKCAARPTVRKGSVIEVPEFESCPSTATK